MPIMSYSLDYLIEKYGEAVHDLATGEGDARSRVRSAYYRFWHVRLEEHPETVREHREKITKLLTRLGGRPGHILDENFNRMKNKTASKAAALILSIFLDLLREGERQAAKAEAKRGS